VLAAEGVTAQTIVKDGVQIAMRSLNDKCTVEHFNLLEVMLAGRAVTTVMKHFYPGNAPPEPGKGTVVIATLEGDVHDLGKNILKMVLMGNGFRVVDCGKNCSVDRLIDTVVKEQPQFVGISGLITSIAPLVRTVRDRLQQEGLGHVKVIAGGAALKQASPEVLNVDFVAENAFDGAEFIAAAAPGTA